MGIGTRKILCRRHREANVLVPERCRERRGFESVLRDEVAVDLVRGRGEHRRRQQLHVSLAIDAGLAHQRDRFTQATRSRRQAGNCR